MTVRDECNGVFNYYIHLWKTFSTKKKFQLSLVLLLMLGNSFAEVISIGAIIPFIGALMAPDKVLNSEILQIIPIGNLSIGPDNIGLIMTSVFCSAVILSGLIRMALIVAQTRIAHQIGSDLSCLIFATALHQPLEKQYVQKSSKVISTIILRSNGVVYQTVLPILTIINSTLLILAILTLLIFSQPFQATIAALGFGALYVITIFVSKNYLLVKSRAVSLNQTKIVKSLQEGIGGIRYVLIDKTQQYFINIYKNADLKMRNSQADIEILGGTPRTIIETIGILLIALISFNLFKSEKNIVEFISIIAVVAFSAQRLLPSFQQAYAGFTSLAGGREMLIEVIDMVRGETISPRISASGPALKFNDRITLKNVSFSYKTGNGPVLKDVNLSILKGSRVGIVGETGSGKSTLADIMMGLLTPDKGKFFIDDTIITESNCFLWQKIVSHVPQSIFFSDATIAENIAYGMKLSDINIEKVKAVAKISQISDFIEGLENGYYSPIGESSSLISGGQAQRLGIARSLYKGAKVLFLDEATNALDAATEQSVLEALHQLGPDITTISIAHRPSVIAACDILFKVKNGEVSICNGL